MPLHVSRALVFLTTVLAAAGGSPCLLAQDRPTPPPARDTPARSTAGSGIIRGRVTEADTDRPLARVDIRAISPGVPQPHSVKTDASGRYEVAGLPPGRYVVAASKTNFLTTSLGATRVMGPGKGFDLSDGQVADKVDLTLLHAGVIAGKVVDEFGDPVADVQVATMRYQYVNGKREMRPAQGHAMTNDIGEFRAFGLPPGDYFVTAAMPSFLGGDNISPALYAPTFYPGTGDPAEAQRLTVGAGQTVSGITVPLVSVRAVRISGSAVDANGRPAAASFVSLDREGAGLGFGGFAAVRPDGTFAIGGVTPGDYTLQISAGLSGESAVMRLQVAGTDVSDVQLVTAPPSVLRGRIVFEADAAPLKSSAIHPTAVRSGPAVAGGVVKVAVHDDLTFQIEVGAGHYLIRTMNPGPLWRLNRVVVNGLDVTDAGLDLPANATLSNIVVEMTHHVSELSGHVVGADGQRLRDCYVIVFAQDPARWTTQTRHVATARPTSDEQFRVLLPAGDYFVLATSDVEPGQWTDPGYLAQIRGRAIAVSIGADEKKKIELKLAAVPEG